MVLARPSQGLLAGARDMLMKYVARMTATLETSCKKQTMPGQRCGEVCGKHMCVNRESYKCNSCVEMSWCVLAEAFEPLSAP